MLYQYNNVKIPFFGAEMTKLSVNINKIATIRNARGANNPNVVKVALDCERFGAQGITVHPRPDERHIRYQDVYDLKQVVHTEYNIEGNPIPDFIDLVLKIPCTHNSFFNVSVYLLEVPQPARVIAFMMGE